MTNNLIHAAHLFRQAEPEVWPPLRQSPGIDWHRHEHDDHYSLRACIVIWIVGAALGWAVAAGAVWGILDAIARAGS